MGATCCCESQAEISQPILVRQEVLEQIARRLQIARVPVTLDEISHGEAFDPLARRLRHGINETVRLHVYDLEFLNVDLKWIGDLAGSQLVHTGVEVFQLEFFFGVDGILAIWPGTYDSRRHREVLPIGTTDLAAKEVLALLQKMNTEWLAKDYKLIGWNCQTFALEFVKALGLNEASIPPEYTMFAHRDARPPPSCIGASPTSSNLPTLPTRELTSSSTGGGGMIRL